MPVTIACPKCQTRYKLPDSALGKPVKCKNCGAGFKTKAGPTVQAQQQPAPAKQKLPSRQSPSQNVSQQQKAQEMAKLGIDGPLRRQADIFGAALPQGASQLGNYAAEDPGFDDRAVAGVGLESEKEQGPTDEGMEAILDNPFVSPQSSGSKVKKQRAKRRTTTESSRYTVAKIGIRVFQVSLFVLLGVGAALGLLTILGRTGALAEIVKATGSSAAWFLGILYVVLFGAYCLSLFFAFIGQVICIFSPEGDEKLFAGLAVGSLVSAGVVVLVMVIMGIAQASSVSPDSPNLGQGAAVLAIGGLVGAFLVYSLILSNLLFRRWV